ncbi:Toll/interleukin-1 receptor domain-containing protein [Tanacetum coccineum]|uniref:Toll/interleukin-1 receptor domain-containing protein n=1 Tax=Tanacetum coccineum TaxID=301880 RepID=A0ABQ5D2R0_9ASTR
MIPFVSSVHGSKMDLNVVLISPYIGVGWDRKGTSLANVSISYLFHEFNRSSFVGNISRRLLEKSNGLLDVQKQLCDDISKASSIPVHDVSVYTSTIENALARKKVFIVLDVMMSRPGHPLALKVLGRLLHERDVAYWEDCIEGQKKEPDFNINNVLRMSFNSLPSENDKELFKHIACFFVGKDRDFTETILKACNINTISGITRLIDRCLLHIDRDNVLRVKVDLLLHELDMRMLEKEKLRGSSELETVAFSNMDSLMILHLDYSCPKANLVALDWYYAISNSLICLVGSLNEMRRGKSEQLRGVGGFCELPTLESLFLNGCNKGELAVVEAVQRDFKSSAVYFPSSLVMLSLANNNLSNESFPMDLSCLSMLKELCLDGNPIVSMPDCVRTLPRLKLLFMRDCVMLGSIEHPPRTLSCLSLLPNGRHMSCIRKISFDQEMSPLDLQTTLIGLPASSIEIEGIIKIQPIAGVDDTILCSLGWSNLEFLMLERKYLLNLTYITIYGGKVMPTWIKRRRKGPSISFTIPSSPNKLRGLNLSYVQTLIRPYWRSKVQYENSEYPLHQFIYLPHIKIRNMTKNLTWLYTHHLYRVNVGGKSLTFLSHWMFGENEMEDGDQLTISIEGPSIKHEMKFEREVGNEMEDGDQLTNYSRIRECGVSFVYDDEKNEKEEDPLSYYKSWNHIIGGDLSSFQFTTQEYSLNSSIYYLFSYKDKERLFKAFSQKNSNTRGRAIEVVILVMFNRFIRNESLHKLQTFEFDHNNFCSLMFNLSISSSFQAAAASIPLSNFYLKIPSDQHCQLVIHCNHE